MVEFYSVLTKTGLAKLALAPQQPLVITDMVLGDGGGESYNPTKQELIDSTALINAVYTHPIDSGSISSVDNTFEVLGNIPNSQGGWWVREVGILDADGDLVAVAKVAPFFKPISIIGVDRETVIRIIVAVDNAENIEIIANPVIGVPASKTSPGKMGQMAMDENFLYYCYDDDKWQRVAKDAGWND